MTKPHLSLSPCFLQSIQAVSAGDMEGAIAALSHGSPPPPERPLSSTSHACAPISVNRASPAPDPHPAPIPAPSISVLAGA